MLRSLEHLFNSKIFTKGVKQVAAGYVVYGSSTMIVYTTGNGVNGFTLDPSIGTYYLSHPEYEIPNYGKKFIPLTKEITLNFLKV